LTIHWDITKQGLSVLQLTSFRFCPACGSGSIIENDSKSMKCGACGFLYFHNMAAAAGCILETKQGILCVRRGKEPKKGMLDLAGGFSDYNESLEATVAREVMEELNLSISCPRYFGSFPNLYEYAGVTYPTQDSVFIGTVTDIKPLKLSDEIASIEYVTSDTVKVSDFGFTSVQNAIKKYYNL